MPFPLNHQPESSSLSDVHDQPQSVGRPRSLDEESPSIEQSASNQIPQVKRKRKGHKKSRRGCFTCKKARSKCDETRPTCDYCFNRGMFCQWPDIQGQEISRGIETTAIENVFQVSAPVFTMQDFRLFSHFIESAYPKRPFHNDSVWQHEIPSISSDYDYLLHSMLALSASDMTQLHPTILSFGYVALSYRLKAITSLKAALSSGIQSFEQGNAMLATCYNLFAQSTLIEDGVLEYMTFIRGCIVLGLQMLARNIKFVFHSMFGTENVARLSPGLKSAPLINADKARAACASLERCQALCVKPKELEMLGRLLGSARSLLTSSHDAFMELRKVYGLFSHHMDHEEFRDFTDPTNEVGRLLQSHFVALHLIMAPISRIVLDQRTPTWAESWKNESKTCWLSSMHQSLPAHMLKYYEWPISVQNDFKGGDYWLGLIQDEREPSSTSGLTSI